MTYQETFVQRDQHRIYVRDHSGTEPAIILMHGFPDNVHLYDRLSPYLSPPRRVVLFDFLGWGSSDKPPATLTRPIIKSVTLTPSSPNWGSGKSSSLPTTPQAHPRSTGHWPTPNAWPGWCY